MKIEHLEDRVNEYTTSIEAVVVKKELWDPQVKDMLRATLKKVIDRYDIGWRIQELDWLYNNDAINITFEAFPNALLSKTDQCPRYNFIPGGALVFTQSYNGDIYVFITFPQAENMTNGNNPKDLGFYHPKDITEKLIFEKVDEFLKEMTNWELPAVKNKVGFQS
nr:hypothetical protein [uncultured bacterium]